MTRISPRTYPRLKSADDLLPGDQVAVISSVTSGMAQDKRFAVVTVHGVTRRDEQTRYLYVSDSEYPTVVYPTDEIYLIDRPFDPEPGTVVARRVPSPAAPAPGQTLPPPTVWLYGRGISQWLSLTAPAPHSLSTAGMRAEHDAGNVTVLYTAPPPGPVAPVAPAPPQGGHQPC